MNRTLRYVIISLLVVAAIGGVIWWQRQPADESSMAERTATVERGPMIVTVTAAGTVEPEARAGLAFEIPGRVETVAVKVGEPVETEQMMAQLDTRSLEEQVEQAEASLELAQAQLAQLVAGPRPQEIAATEARGLRAAEAQLAAAIANRDQIRAGASEAEIASAEAQIAQAELKVKSAQLEYDRVRAEDRSETTVENAKEDLYVAEQELAAVQAELEELLAGVDPEELRAAEADVWAAAAQRDAAQAQLELMKAGPTQEQIDNAAAQVAQAQAALDQARLSLARATLYAPFDGVVAAINAVAGEQAPVGRPALVLLDTSGFHVETSADELDIARLEPGQSAEITLDALPDVTLMGVVDRIAPISQMEGGIVTYDVTVALDPTDAPIKADMTASLTILVQELENVLQVPTWMVRVDRTTGQTYVHRQMGEDVEAVDVSLGIRYEGMSQVIGGDLEEGDTLVWIPQDENQLVQ